MSIQAYFRMWLANEIIMSALFKKRGSLFCLSFLNLIDMYGLALSKCFLSYIKLFITFISLYFISDGFEPNK